MAVLVSRNNGCDIDDFNDVGNGDNVTVATASASMTKMKTTATGGSYNADVTYNNENLPQRQRKQNHH